MVNISKNGFITLNRGDTVQTSLFINIGTPCSPSRYYIKDHPKTVAYLGVIEPNQPFENAIIRKKYTSESPINEDGDLIIEITSKDTEYLLPGKYYYMVKVVFDDGTIDTIIPKTDFIIYD